MKYINFDNRHGKITSSNIYKLFESNTIRASYLKELAISDRIGRSIDSVGATKPMIWGRVMEEYAHESHLSDYDRCSSLTIQHPTVDFWAGTPDFKKNKTDELFSEPVLVAEFKAYQLKKFAEFTDALHSKDILLIKKTFPQEYWQVVSNSILLGVEYAELISFCPYESELEKVAEYICNYNGDIMLQDLYHLNFDLSQKRVAYLPDGGYYKNLNIFRFEVSVEDKRLLEKVVKEIWPQI